MQFRLRTLLAGVAAASCCLALVLWIRSVDWSYIHIASVDCGGGRTIHLYEESFCDFATTPVYDVEIDGKIRTKKFLTGLWYDCGNRPEFNSISTVSDDSGNLVAVFRDGDDLIAIYNFETRENIEQPSSGRIEDLPREILDRLPIENRIKKNGG